MFNFLLLQCTEPQILKKEMRFNICLQTSLSNPDGFLSAVGTNIKTKEEAFEFGQLCLIEDPLQKNSTKLENEFYPQKTVTDLLKAFYKTQAYDEILILISLPFFHAENLKQLGAHKFDSFYDAYITSEIAEANKMKDEFALQLNNALIHEVLSTFKKEEDYTFLRTFCQQFFWHQKDWAEWIFNCFSLHLDIANPREQPANVIRQKIIHILHISKQLGFDSSENIFLALNFYQQKYAQENGFNVNVGFKIGEGFVKDAKKRARHLSLYVTLVLQTIENFQPKNIEEVL